jgi:hypothetical protein
MSIISARARRGKPAPRAGRAARVVLRRNRSLSGERLTVLYGEASVRLELASSGRVVASGPWQAEVLDGGRPLLPVSAWHSTCRVSDDDVDYLELDMQLTGGFRIERHLVLARKDRFLLLADAVLGSRPGRIEYRGRLPLGPGIALRSAAETREGFLVAAPRGKRLATVLPLALPEWRCDVRVGELLGSPGEMELRQAIEGRRLFAPLWFDLDPRRARRLRTWRQLTVAESQAAQAADVAVGYRVAVGSRQWLIYRSLAAKCNRTLLGHNLGTETLVAGFRRNGEVKSIIEIE